VLGHQLTKTGTNVAAVVNTLSSFYALKLSSMYSTYPAALAQLSQAIGGVGGGGNAKYLRTLPAQCIGCGYKH